MTEHYYCHVCGMSVSEKNSFVCSNCGQMVCRRCAVESKFTCPDCKGDIPHLNC